MTAAAPIAADRAILYLVGDSRPQPAATPEALGFKAYNLARMAAIGLNVPPAFVIGTGYCAAPKAVTPDLWRDPLAALEIAAGQRLGDPRRPLLLSVRSGAPVSMPGMMETLLNIGLCDTTLPGFIRQTGHPRLAWDAYRRLVAGFGEVVAGIDAAAFEADLAAVGAGASDRDLDFAAQREVTRRHLDTYRLQAGEAFPQDAHAQLQAAIEAVFLSWSSDKARAYRALRGLSDAMGTAVTVQRMIFGNGGGLSGAGVGFTRNPIDGAPEPWVDFLFNAQGEDVVSGRRSAQGHESLAAVAPAVWQDLLEATRQLERNFGEMQDFEFTVQEGKLFLLQSRDGKRTPQATARIALDMADEGLISRDTARQRTEGLRPEDLATTVLAAEDGGALTPIARAATAASGVVSGVIAFDETQARRLKTAGHTVILVRRDAETRDIAALDQAVGLLTQHGARTSHAAVVARQLGKVCLVGCEEMQLDEAGGRMTLGGQVFETGAPLTLDGNEGLIYGTAARVVRQLPEALVDRLTALRAMP